MNRTIVINAIEPAPLSLRHPFGVSLDLRLTMKEQNGSFADTAALQPQFVLLPRSRGGIYAYDMEAYDPANGVARVEINGTAFIDWAGYAIELYSRQPNPSGVGSDPPVPVALLATGVLAMQGMAHQRMGPLGMISVPTVTGPQGEKGQTGEIGPAGPTGVRGSVWYTGATDPGYIPGQMIGDMYLDESTGNVWRFDGDMWLRGTFQ